jgi:hypothetical protein
MAFLKVTMEGGSLQDLLAAQRPLPSTRVIEIPLDLSRAKELTAKAISSLDDLVRAGDDDIGRIAESIRTRLDKASARGEMAAHPPGRPDG